MPDDQAPGAAKAAADKAAADAADKAAKDAANKAAAEAADKAAKDAKAADAKAAREDQARRENDERARAAMIQVSRDDLDHLGACAQGHATFAERFEGIDGATFDAATETWTLARGWTRDVTRKLALEAPVSLRWYVRHGFAPADCGWREAIQRAQAVPGGAVRPSLLGRVAA